MLAMFPPRMLAATKNPGLMGLMAKSVVHEDQGVLQGSIMSLRVLAKVRGVLCWFGGDTDKLIDWTFTKINKPTTTNDDGRRSARPSSAKSSSTCSTPASSGGRAPGLLVCILRACQPTCVYCM